MLLLFFSCQRVLELEKENTLLKHEKEELNQRIKSESNNVAGEMEYCGGTIYLCFLTVKALVVKVTS